VSDEHLTVVDERAIPAAAILMSQQLRDHRPLIHARPAVMPISSISAHTNPSVQVQQA
jgi:hypothetical protein